MNIGRRFIPAITPAALRIATPAGHAGQDAQYCEGYSAVYFDPSNPKTEYELYPGLKERVMPGAFEDALRSGDEIYSCWNHSPDNPLGRRGNGTLALRTDSTGLFYSVKLP